MNRPRKQTYTMDMYLGKIKDRDIRNDSDTQRQFVWTNEQINELLYTVLSEDYIPSIILGEVDNSQLWIVDGGQRSSSFNMFRYGNYKITSAIENSIISYKKKVIDESGNIKWKDEIFDIKNKTYDKLPEELQKRFNEYQIETVIHEGCDTHRIAQLLKRYNNHTSMNTNQKAFTYIDKYAREIRNILDSRFFLDCGAYTEKERSKGVLERVILESIMCMFHFDHWKKQPKQVANHLNNNSTAEEFELFNSFVKRLENIIADDLKDLFSSKDSFIWFTMFKKFTELGIDDKKFAEFLRDFKSGLNTKLVNGTTFVELDENRGTKDRALVYAKINLLTSLMFEYFGYDRELMSDEAILAFVQGNVDATIDREDVELYAEIFSDLTDDTPFKNVAVKNKASVMSIIAFACVNDIDLDNCIATLLADTSLSGNQTENYLNMKKRLEGKVGLSA